MAFACMGCERAGGRCPQHAWGVSEQGSVPSAYGPGPGLVVWGSRHVAQALYCYVVQAVLVVKHSNVCYMYTPT